MEEDQEVTYRATRKKKMKPSEINSGDRISKLPDPLLHHILSFLDMKFAIQTCILSRRWRYVWISLPVLSFDERVFEDPDECFMEFVNRAVHCRGATKINEFHLSCDDKEYDGASIFLESFMPVLARRKVEVFDLKASFEGRIPMLDLPESFFRCTSLTTLNLDMGLRKRPFWKTPDLEYERWPPLRNLKTLHLRSFWLVGGVNHFIRMCPSLETLVIANCMYDGRELEIEHLLLNNLVIQTMTSGEYSLDYCEILVYAPKLRTFSCRDYPINAYNLQMFHFPVYDSKFEWIGPSLEKADIDTDFMADYYLKPTQRADKHTYSENVKTCLRGLQRVKFLTVSAWLLEIANEAPADDWQRLYGVKVAAFCNLRVLTLKTSLSVCQIHAISNLLKVCPVLETLVLKMTKEPELPSRHTVGEVKSNSGKEDGHWNAELAPRSKIRHLKSIEIKDIQTSPNELDFLKFLIRNAAVLEKIIVYASKKQLTNERERKRLGERLMKFRGPSSRIGILFL